MEQVKAALAAMPSETDIQKRDRALFAFILVTGARDGAVISLQLKHLDVAARRVDQDAREVSTKFAKSFSTTFFRVGGDVEKIVVDWVEHLRVALLWSPTDPLFPATSVESGADRRFAAAGLTREAWKTASPIREIFRAAFARVGLPYFSPHTFRHTLAQFGEQVCVGPEQFKAWSQNLGHENVSTTFTSYGRVRPERQAELINRIGVKSTDDNAIPPEMMARIMRLMSGA